MTKRAVLCLLAACGSNAPTAATTPLAPPAPPPPDRSVIIVVWDGLRPDTITAEDTPTLVALRGRGVEFTDNHSTYPTFTMMNAASFATGQFSGATGYYGNTLWQRDAKGSDSAGKPVDYLQPVFSEDYAVLDGLKAPNASLLADTLFTAAQAAGMATAAIGKTGAAYLQDSGRGGVILDERTAWPLDFVKQLQAAGVALPQTTVNMYPGQLELRADNGNPVAFQPIKKLADGVTSDADDSTGSPYKAAVDFLATTYLEHVLPDRKPRLSVVWLRDPDTVQHQFGIGTANWHDAMRANDAVLSKLIAKLDALGIKDKTDIIVVSDHGHSNVSGPQDLFPLRAASGKPDPHGHSVSGMVRIADLLNRAGFTAYDGLGCTFIPTAMGIRKNDEPVYRTKEAPDDKTCGKPNQKYQIGQLKVPGGSLAHTLVVAVNGGSDYIYVPDHDAALVRKVVGFLQSRSEVGAIFVDDRYTGLPGTLPLTAIHARNKQGKNPDIILSYDYDTDAKVDGVPGTEMAGVLGGNGYRGMHGSFSPRDVHNTLIAAGPDFQRGMKDPLPSGNVDVAPTVARILGLALPHAQGRPLLEAMVGGAPVADYHAAPKVQASTPATGLKIALPTDPDGKDVAPGLTTYSFELHTKQLSYGSATYTYYDYAKATRR